MQHREVALDLLKAKEEDYPVYNIVIPPSTLENDLAHVDQHPGKTLIVTDPNQERVQLNVHPRILALNSQHFQDFFVQVLSRTFIFLLFSY